MKNMFKSKRGVIVAVLMLMLISLSSCKKVDEDLPKDNKVDAIQPEAEDETTVENKENDKKEDVNDKEDKKESLEFTSTNNKSVEIGDTFNIDNFTITVKSINVDNKNLQIKYDFTNTGETVAAPDFDIVIKGQQGTKELFNDNFHKEKADIYVSPGVTEKDIVTYLPIDDIEKPYIVIFDAANATNASQMHSIRIEL